LRQTANLFVGDDGSDDDSLRILGEFESDFTSFHLSKFDRLGTAQNFLQLLGKSSAEFVALADQDDIWDETKLIDSIKALKPNARTREPALYVSPTRILNRSKVLKPLIYPFPLDFYSNRAQGCTFVLNKRLVNQILNISTSGIEHLDWVIFLYAKYFGKIVVGEIPNMSYRLHGTNSVGSSGIRGARTRLKDPLTINVRRNIIEKQLNEFEKLFEEMGSEVLIKKIQQQQELFKAFSLKNYLNFLGLSTLIRYPAKSMYFGILIMVSSKKSKDGNHSDQDYSKGVQGK
jgi:rhamnosyltransferase